MQPVVERVSMEGQFTYLDFDLLIEPGAQGGYRARVLRSPAGESAAVQFTLPFSPVELENLVLKVGRARRRTRGPGRPESAPLKEFGGKLYGAVFQDELRDLLRSSLSQIRAQRVGMRLRLRLTDVPELAELPWEFLYDPRLNRFLAQSRHTPLVRYLDLPDPPHPLSVAGPLRLLVVISSPSGYPELDVEQEWNALTGALAEQIAEGRVVVERLPANMSALRRRLRHEEFHIFHFVGHGFYRPDWGDGVLVMEGRDGRPREVPGEELGGLLNEYEQTRLVVLNACEGARGGVSDPFAGMAQSLIQQGLPAVVAMQFEITDDAAIIFADELYAAIADGYPLEAALAEARGAIRDEGNLTEWGTPVLYSRAPDGHLFDLSGPGRIAGIADQARQGAAQKARQEVEREARQGAEAWAAPDRIVIPLTQGNINHNHVYLARHLGFFPADAIGGHNKQAGQGRPLKLHFEGFPGTEATDITSDHKSFRVRKPWQKFFERHDLRAGDKVAVERISAYEYRVVPVRSVQPGRSEHLIALAAEHVADVPPFTALRRADEQDLDGQRRLMVLLREATGIIDVEPERPGIGAAVMLDRAIGTKSTQRIALQQQSGSLALCTWPAELKSQAEALYRTGRAGRLMGFLAARPGVWQARPNIQLAFRNAPGAQRLFPHCHLEITEYVQRWSGDDFGKIGAHSFDHVREDLWPWLRERQYASPEDDQQLDAFLKRLGRRDAHLRPGIEVRRTWPRAHAVDLDERGALASEVRTAVVELLTALDERLPPACIAV
jgi:hypothetical protein